MAEHPESQPRIDMASSTQRALIAGGVAGVAESFVTMPFEARARRRALHLARARMGRAWHHCKTAACLRCRR